jgi:hypothetical protein
MIGLLPAAARRAYDLLFRKASGVDFARPVRFRLRFSALIYMILMGFAL